MFLDQHDHKVKIEVNVEQIVPFSQTTLQSVCGLLLLLKLALGLCTVRFLFFYTVVYSESGCVHAAGFVSVLVCVTMKITPRIIVVKSDHCLKELRVLLSSICFTRFELEQNDLFHTLNKMSTSSTWNHLLSKSVVCLF